GKDYMVAVKDGEYKWKKYVYTIYSENFTSEGNYSICISSKDQAGNISNNEEKDQNIRFTIDKTAPTLTTAGIESNTIYNAAIGMLDMIATDNIRVNQVSLYLNGEGYREWKRDELDEAFGQIQADIPGSDNRQNIEIVLTDVAGNRSTYSIQNFLITQNKWVQYYNNKKAVVGTIGGAGLGVATICFVLLRRRRL
ncbi:MAG: hypothetical protein IKL07_11020, partial [Clostridium sp.]|nr:hypothetical protein [Clostridium sp.]